MPVAGSPAPTFTLPAIDTEGVQSDISLETLLETGPVLLVFYQDDGMPICTRELQAFAQEHMLLANAGYHVLGINSNGLGSHTKFQERDRFPFPLISDFDGETIKAYGMWDPDEGKSKRGVVAIGQDGRITYVLAHFNPGSVAAFEGIFRSLGLT